MTYSNRLVIKLVDGTSAVVGLSLDTERLITSILAEKPTQPMYQTYLQRMLLKLKDLSTTPYLVDVELALLDDLVSSLPGVDFARLEAARDAWTTAYDKLIPAAQKGIALLTRALRAMFTASSQPEFEKKVTMLIETLPEEDRVSSLEFAEELLVSLLKHVEDDGGSTWNPDEVNYLDNHVYYQLYQDIVKTSLDIRGKALAARRLHLLASLIRTFQF